MSKTPITHDMRASEAAEIYAHNSTLGWDDEQLLKTERFEQMVANAYMDGVLFGMSQALLISSGKMKVGKK